jgi:RNA polymerase sigma-70 factor (ECF subfamily)
MGHRENQTAAAFRTTRWSVVAHAAAPAHPQAGAALADICHNYWPPLYAFARRLGRSPHDAEDLTQSFFAVFIEKNSLAAAEQSRGKLRTFLLAAFQNHITDTARREHALKRGGGAEMLNFDAAAAEEWFAGEPAERATPETLYHQRWALLLLERALDALETERAAGGQGATMQGVCKEGKRALFPLWRDDEVIGDV